jgi:hypothetical protein
MNNLVNIVGKARNERIGTSLLMMGYFVSSLAACLVGPLGTASASSSIQLMSVNNAGQQLNSGSFSPVVSEDGRYVAFTTGATNLVPSNAPANLSQVFVRDRFTSTTMLESVKPNGDFPRNAGGSLVLSPNGHYLAFTGSFAGDDGSLNVYVKDLQNGSITLASPRYTTNAPPFDGNMGGVQGVSNDGRFVVFQSSGGQFIPGVPDGYDKIYVRDLANQTYILASSNIAGEVADSSSFDASMSADGRYVMYGSVANNLDPNRPSFNGFPRPSDQYIKDLQTGTVRTVSTGPNGEYGNARSFAGTISPDGTHIVFSSVATNFGYSVSGFPNVYVKDITTGQLTFVTGGRNVPGTGVSSGSLSISGDNQHVLFIDAHNNDSVSVQDVMEWDQASGQLTMITIPPAPGTFPAPPHNVTTQALTFDGQAVFSSRTSNLVPNDTNGAGDIFFYGRLPDATPPTVSGSLVPAANSVGWNNTTVTVNWTATDADSPATTPAPTVVSTEGKNQVITSGPSCDPSNNCAIGSVTLNIDKTAPTLAIPVWANNPKPLSGTSSIATMTVTATDSLSGIAKAEYFIGNTDPGQGNGAAMNVGTIRINTDGTISADLSTSFGTDFTTPGRYAINVRTQDLAGNWSDVETDYLIVYDQTGPTDVTASKQIVPSADNGDNLPGIATSSKNDKANLDFDVSYTSTGNVAAGSYANLNYAIGNACKTHPENCLSTSFVATTVSPNSIDWLTLTNSNTVGTFQGKGTLTVNDHSAITTTSNPFKVVATIGSNNTAVMYIYAAGANPSTATPLYQLTISAHGNWVRIQ